MYSMSELSLAKARLSIGTLKTLVATQLTRGDTTATNSNPMNYDSLLAQASIIEKIIRCINKLDQLRIEIGTADDPELEASDMPLQRARLEIEDDICQLLREWQMLDWELTSAMADDPDLRSHDERCTTSRRKLFSWRSPTLKSPEGSKTSALSIIIGEFICIFQSILLITNANSDEAPNEEQHNPSDRESSPQSELRAAFEPVCQDTAPPDNDSAPLHGLAFSPDDDDVLSDWLRAFELLSSGSSGIQD
jgi:hypothetical protein